MAVLNPAVHGFLFYQVSDCWECLHFQLCFCFDCKGLRQEYTPDSVFITIVSVLSFYSVHMMAEGYIFASGSFLFLYLWLSISLISPSAFQNLDVHNKSLFDSNRSL